MRRLIQVLVVLAAASFVIGIAGCFRLRPNLPGLLIYLAPPFSPETYWRGCTALLLFAMTFMMMRRDQGP